jgi:hypothetical protein
MAGFLAGSELRHRTKDAYLHKMFERLVALKASTTPRMFSASATNLFHKGRLKPEKLSKNISP